MAKSSPKLPKPKRLVTPTPPVVQPLSGGDTDPPPKPPKKD